MQKMKTLEEEVATMRLGSDDGEHIKTAVVGGLPMNYTAEDNFTWLADRLWKNWAASPASRW